MEWIYSNDGENGHTYPRVKENMKNEKTWLGDSGMVRVVIKEEKKDEK